jgi:hypothetical protein
MKRLKTEITKDYRDFLQYFEKYKVRYLIIGGYAFAFHAFPRYTKDIDVLIDNSAINVERANLALKEFGSPFLLDPKDKNTILQLGIAPNRIDILMKVENAAFETIWKEKVRGKYGDISVNWMGLKGLIRSKSRIAGDRHREDVRFLRKLKERLKKK